MSPKKDEIPATVTTARFAMFKHFEAFIVGKGVSGQQLRLVTDWFDDGATVCCYGNILKQPGASEALGGKVKVVTHRKPGEPEQRLKLPGLPDAWVLLAWCKP